MVWPRNPQAGIRNTLDDEYISRACPDRSEWHTVTDSDELCVIEFSERTHKPGMVAERPLSDRDMVQFIHRDTNADHRALVRETIRLHARPIDPVEWEPVVQQADGYVQKYLDLSAAQGPSLDDGPDSSGSSRQGPRRGFDRLLGGTSLNELSIPALLLLGLTAPFWILYRLLHHKLYRYLDRLNAEVIETRKQLAVTQQRFEVVLTQLDYLTEAHKRIRARSRRGG
jgi:hypothetical protein